MQQSLSFLTLGVDDLAASRDFYGRLGWQEAPGSRSTLPIYRLGGLILALHEREALAAEAGLPPLASQGRFSGVLLSHNVASAAAVDELLAAATAAGGRCLRPGAQASWGGYRGSFADPAGHVWEVCFNPFHPLDADGQLINS